MIYSDESAVAFGQSTNRDRSGAGEHNRILTQTVSNSERASENLGVGIGKLVNLSICLGLRHWFTTRQPLPPVTKTYGRHVRQLTPNAVLVDYAARFLQPDLLGV